MSEKVERLTDEQVAETIDCARIFVGYFSDPRARMMALALLQVSADLSAAKEERDACATFKDQWFAKYNTASRAVGKALEENARLSAALSALQEKARAVLAARSCCDPACCKASSEHTKALEALAEELR